MVKWNEYEALRDHLKKQIDKSDEEWRAELQRVDLKLDATATQESVTNMQESITTLTREIADLATFVQRRYPQENDNASVHGGNPHGNEGADFDGGRGERGHVAAHGRGFHAFARRVPMPENNREEDGLGKPKFSIPSFTFDTNDVEEYLMWELKIEKL